LKIFLPLGLVWLSMSCASLAQAAAPPPSAPPAAQQPPQRNEAGAATAELEEETPVRLRINRTVSSADAHVGDTVDFEV
jgi:hypothetical protein